MLPTYLLTYLPTYLPTYPRTYLPTYLPSRGNLSSLPMSRAPEAPLFHSGYERIKQTVFRLVEKHGEGEAQVHFRQSLLTSYLPLVVSGDDGKSEMHMVLYTTQKHSATKHNAND